MGDGERVTYGARFLDELRRLTTSTFGFTYQEGEAIRAMDQDQLTTFLIGRTADWGLHWLHTHQHLPADELAKAIAEESERRRAEADTRVTWRDFDISDLFDS
jgi:hypothetical protein